VTRDPEARARHLRAGDLMLVDGAWVRVEAVIPHRSPLGGETVTVRLAGRRAELGFDPSEPVARMVGV
jgi:hypothetical protein